MSAMNAERLLECGVSIQRGMQEQLRSPSRLKRYLPFDWGNFCARSSGCGGRSPEAAALPEGDYAGERSAPRLCFIAAVTV